MLCLRGESFSVIELKMPSLVLNTLRLKTFTLLISRTISVELNNVHRFHSEYITVDGKPNLRLTLNTLQRIEKHFALQFKTFYIHRQNLGWFFEVLVVVDSSTQGDSRRVVAP